MIILECLFLLEQESCVDVEGAVAVGRASACDIPAFVVLIKVGHPVLGGRNKLIQFVVGVGSNHNTALFDAGDIAHSVVGVGGFSAPKAVYLPSGSFEFARLGR